MDDMLLTIKGKGDKERRIPFSGELRKVLFRYGQFKDKRGFHSNYVFCSRSASPITYRNAARDFKKLKEKTGLPEKPAFRQLRHTFATHYLRGGGE